MAYSVNITSRAERDLSQLYGQIDAERSDAALEWYQGSKKRFSAWKSSRTDAL